MLIRGPHKNLHLQGRKNILKDFSGLKISSHMFQVKNVGEISYNPFDLCDNVVKYTQMVFICFTKDQMHIYLMKMI